MKRRFGSDLCPVMAGTVESSFHWRKRMSMLDSVRRQFVEMGNDFLTLHTSLAPDALREKLRRWEPWNQRLDFDNGVSTLDCARRASFSEWPLRTFAQAALVVPFGELAGGRLLDIGSNTGCNSIHAALKYQFSTTGVDINRHNIEVARFLAALAGVSSEFELANGETFSRPGEFDVVLHFGVLCRLRNPLLSLQRAFENLKPGGYLALETEVYDRNLHYFIDMQDTDRINAWPLSAATLIKNLELIGFANIQEVKEPALREHNQAHQMDPLMIVARKPSLAQEIIRRAMADRSIYDAMAAREKEVWGTVLPDLERSEMQTKDAAASEILGIERNTSALFWVAAKQGLKFEQGLTLGCGTGRCERELLAKGVCRRFHGIDISEDAIIAAREIARDQNLPITYEVDDLNFVELPEKTFDLVVAQTSLHHVLFLERVAEQVWRSLKSDGYLWIHDFIGETQWQYDPKRLSLMNDILAALPEKFRRNTLNGQLLTEISRPEPGHLGSPFESIRSGEIMPVFQRWFTIEWKMEFDAFVRFVVPRGTRAAYLENEDTKALFEILMLLDRLCIDEKIVEPRGGQYLMRPKPLNETPVKNATS
jgi:2-polyprenyl-3-methyl-5-hydroxy-6-metoxy-1,4-benzoquinol methylase